MRSQAKAELATLVESMNNLEAQIEPLFAKTLPETVVALEPIQQAKLQTVLPYLVYNLIYVYLKSKGIDPETHPVVPELDRVRNYLRKISHAEDPPTKRAEIDKAAAGRFIKHAITQAAYAKITADDAPVPSSSTRVQAKITSKILQRAEYEKKLKEQDAEGSEEAELEVFEDDDDAGMDVDVDVTKTGGNDKGKEKEVDEPTPQVSHKRSRPSVDPFAGYGDDLRSVFPYPTKKEKNLDSPSPPDSRASADTIVKARRKKKRTIDQTHNTDSSAGTPRPGSNSDVATSPADDSIQGPLASGISDAKRAKRARKKARKSLTAD